MNKLTSIIISLIIIFGIPLTSFAQLDKPFGGKSVFVVPCTCDLTFMVTILDVSQLGVPMNYIYSPLTTQLYAYFLAMTIGVDMLGTASLLPTTCNVASPSGCTPVGFGYTMTMVGTSL